MSFSGTTNFWIEKQSKGAPRTALTCAYFAAFIALGLTTGSLGPTLPDLASQTHVGLSAISYLFTARSAGYVIGSTRGGRLYDRLSGNPVMATTLMVTVALLAIVPLTKSFWPLVFAMFVLGGGEATLDVGANTLLARVHKQRLAPLMNALHSFFGVGALLAPMIVAALISLQRNSVQVYFVLALLLLPLVTWLLFLASPSNEEVTTIERTATSAPRLIFFIAAFLFLYVGAEVGFGGWIFTYTISLNVGSAKSAAYLTSLFFGALTAGRVIAIPLAARFRPVNILFFDLAGALLGLGLLLVFTKSFAVVAIATALVGAFIASIFPTALALAGTRVILTGKVMSRFIVGASLGSMTIPLLIGHLFERFGAMIVMYVVSVTLLTAAFLLFLVVRGEKL